MENNKLFALDLDKKDLIDYCETKIKYFMDLIQRLIGMKSNLGKNFIIN